MLEITKSTINEDDIIVLNEYTYNADSQSFNFTIKVNNENNIDISTAEADSYGITVFDGDGEWVEDEDGNEEYEPAPVWFKIPNDELDPYTEELWEKCDSIEEFKKELEKFLAMYW